MFAKNITTLLHLLIKDGKLNIDMEDEVIRETVVTHGGEVGNSKVREALGMATAPIS
jgi:NAD(P) transhydrogenase subunit alpha